MVWPLGIITGKMRRLVLIALVLSIIASSAAENSARIRILSAETGAVVTLGANTADLCNLTISANGVTIIGDGAVTIIDCANAARHLSITGSNVTIRGVQFRNGFSSEGGGGCLLVLGDGLLLDNVSLTNCTSATGDGGGLMASGEGLRLRNARITNCSAILGNGGGLWSAFPLAETISGDISFNTAGNSGGGVYIRDAGVVDFSGSLQLNQAIGGSGGGLFLEQQGSSLSFSGVSTCANNTAQGGYGGGFYSSGGTVTITDSARVSFNQAGVNGGGGCLFGGRGMTVNGNAVIEGNSARNGGGLYANTAGAVVIAGSALIAKNNATAARGGGVYIAGSRPSLTIKDAATFRSNTAVQAAGLFITVAGQITVTDWALFDSNAARGTMSWDGLSGVSGTAGGMWAETFTSMLVSGDATFQDNRGNIAGGGLVARNGPINITDRVRVLRNRVGYRRGIGRGRQGAGAGVYISDSVRGRTRAVIDKDVLFEGNKGVHGGCLFISMQDIIIKDNVVFRRCEGEVVGGAIYAESTSMQIEGHVLFEENRLVDYQTGSGGAIGMLYGLYGSKMRIVSDNVIFRRNSAIGEGGALHFNSVYSVGDNIIIGALFEGNSAQIGGAISIYANSLLQISGRTRFVANTASDGGGLYINDGCGLLADGPSVLFANNSATGAGGGIYLYNVVNFLLTGKVLMQGNTAREGGAIAILGPDVSETIANISETIMQHNHAEKGGAIFASGGGKLYSDNAVFAGNTALYLGGGVCMFTKGAQAFLDSNRFYGNQVLAGADDCSTKYTSCGGGAIATLQDGSVILSNDTVMADNYARGLGGAILLLDLSTLTMAGGTVALTGNRAGISGGSIATVDQSAMTIAGGAQVMVGGCAANVSGGGIYLNGNGLTLSDGSRITVSGNAALNGGGLFSYSRITLDGGSRIVITRNAAAEMGGGAAVHGSVSGIVLADYMSSLLFDGNTAKSGGGGLHLSEGGAFSLATENCDRKCAGRKDGVCSDMCMSRSCNWDTQECTSIFTDAGGASQSACNTSKCDIYAINGQGYDNTCALQCMSSSCDWSLSHGCPYLKQELLKCPLFDMTTFKATVDSNVAYTIGGDVEYNGRCQQSEARFNGNPCDATPTWQEAGLLRFDGAHWVDVRINEDLMGVKANSLTFDIRFRGGSGTLLSMMGLDIAIVDAHTLAVSWAPADFSQPRSLCTLTYVVSKGSFNDWTDIAVAAVDGWWIRINGSQVLNTNGTSCPNALGSQLLFDNYNCAGFTLGPVESMLCYWYIGKGAGIASTSPLFRGQIATLRVWQAPLAAAPNNSIMSIPCARIEDRPAVCFDNFDTVYTFVPDQGGGNARSDGFVLSGAKTETCIVSDTYGVHQMYVIDADFYAFCSPKGKPLLPSLALRYEPGDMMREYQTLRANVHTVLDVALHWPGCGFAPVTFSGNAATDGHGGAIYQDGCDNAQSAHGYCFFTGFKNTGGGTNIVSFVGNRAAGAGGAVYTTCEQPLNQACEDVMAQTVGFGGVFKYLKDDASLDVHNVLFTGNEASAYGDDVATGPAELIVKSVQPAYVPGQTPLNATVVLLDGLGQQLKGSIIVPLAQVVVSELCQAGATMSTCGLTTGLLQAAFHTLDPLTGVAVTYPAQEVRCPSSHDSVMVRVSLLRSEGQLTALHVKSVEAKCLPCQAGEQLTVTGGAYHCVSCGEKKYIVEPNGGQCRDCPAGATCDGSGGIRGKDGSTWDAVGSIYRVSKCVAGYVLVRDNAGNPLDDQCVRCPGSPYPGFYALDTPSWASGVLVSKSVADATTRLCRACPDGATCELGGNSTVALPGYWTLASSGGKDRRVLDYTTNNRSVEIYRCLSTEACVGDNQCKEGATGYVCGICKENYTLAGLSCVFCDPADGLRTPRALLACFIITAALIVWWFVSARPFAALMSERRAAAAAAAAAASQEAIPASTVATIVVQVTPEVAPEIALSTTAINAIAANHRRNSMVDSPAIDVIIPAAARRKSSITDWVLGIKNRFGEMQSQTIKSKKREIDSLLGTVKILISFYQVTSCFLTSFRVPWPSSLSTLFAYASVLRADLLAIPSIACLAANWNHEARLLFYTLVPIGLVLFLGWPLLFARVWLRHTRETSKAFADMEAKFFSTVLFWLFLVYPICSMAVFDTFNCRWIDGKHLLASDLRMICPTSPDTHSRWLAPYAAISILIYPVGIPAAMLWALWHFDVPRMARDKRQNALRSAALAAFRSEHIRAMLSLQGVTSMILDAANFISVRHRDGFVNALVETMRQVRWLAADGAEEEGVRLAAQQVFDHFDANGDGLLSPTEVSAMHLALATTGSDALYLSDDQRMVLLTHRWLRRQEAPDFKAQPTDANLILLCHDLQSEGVLAADTTVFWDTSPDAPRAEAVAVRCVGFLFLSYSVDEWFFDLVEQLRKLLMTSVIVFLMSQPAGQLAVGILITFFALLLNVRLVPFVIRPLNTLQAACLTVQVVTLFYGMLILFDRLYNDATTVAFFMLNALLPAAAIINILSSRASCLRLQQRLCL